ncbi:MAG: Rieske (2Fe-2S) protein [Candidatus Krumholzibacteria bacterium]|nr:Rieske (2Fe-2S) protein [Candidatus Krumholzibacteria bacterium]
MDRRSFTNFFLTGGLLGWLGSVLYPVISYLRPPHVPEADVNVVKAGLASEFPVNSGQIVKFGRKPVILIRTDTGSFRALSATCTHLDCIVQYRTDLKQIWCACHNGLYDTTGRNISGPPPRPLEQYQVNLVGDEIHVARMA